jgi:hypothetical protein
MAHKDWKSGYNNAQRGNDTAPQKPGESKDAFNDRTAGADAARRNQNK